MTAFMGTCLDGARATSHAFFSLRVSVSTGLRSETWRADSCY